PTFPPSWCASARASTTSRSRRSRRSGCRPASRSPSRTITARPRNYPGHPRLGRHLIEKLMQREFDVAASSRLPQSASSNISGLPHAYGFIYRRIMQDNFVPAVPFFVNTFYPPNQPSVRRCFSLGEALADAIASWDADLRVAVIGSGGMSHFVVDEDLD